MSWGAFKEVSHDIGSWILGSVQGGFNEKQTIGQVTTDAIISMFPIAGEITAARDVTACCIRMSEYPEKRHEVLEWVMLILPLLALVPLFGGALKGVGKLLLMVGKNANEDKKILEAIIALLNKVGHGDAVRFVKELDFAKYSKPITEGVTNVCMRIKGSMAAGKSRFKIVLSEKNIKRLDWLAEQLDELTKLVDKYVPQALKDLNNRAKYVQKLLYEGEWHLIPGSGKAITRETEARLVSRAGKMEWELKNAKYPQNKITDFVPEANWPDFKLGKYANDGFGEQIVKSFHGPMAAKKLEDVTIYRVIDHQYGKNESICWLYTDPKTIKGWYWRVKYAVLQSWSHNGKFVKFKIPKGKALHVWEGKVSSQIDNAAIRDSRSVKNLKKTNEGYGQYLEGGETQLIVDFEFAANKWALNDVKALPKLDTNWVDHMDINLVPTTASVQKLGKFVEEQKTLASANLATAANQSGKAVRFANQGNNQNNAK